MNITKPINIDKKIKESVNETARRISTVVEAIKPDRQTSIKRRFDHEALNLGHFDAFRFVW